MPVAEAMNEWCDYNKDVKCPYAVSRTMFPGLKVCAICDTYKHPYGEKEDKDEKPTIQNR